MRKASKVKTPYNDHRSQWVTLGEYKEAKKTGGSIYASKHGSNLVSVEGYGLFLVKIENTSLRSIGIDRERLGMLHVGYSVPGHIGKPYQTLAELSCGRVF